MCIGILFVNARLALGLFLLFTIGGALAVGYLYKGKAWCQYFCPMAPVQMIYNEPRSLFGSEAHQGQKQAITQSMCRTVGRIWKKVPVLAVNHLVSILMRNGLIGKFSINPVGN